ncbi:MAG: cyanoexosortase C [Elainella sp. Prado103]|jgi:exosortase|nr:cyanoexosortase C [Elainella sp. Prado103]
MKWQQQIGWQIRSFLYTHLRTRHGRFVLCGLLVGLCYFPVWLGSLTVAAFQGSAGLPLVTAAVALGLYELWKRRQELSLLTASNEDQFLGHALIVSGAILFPFCRAAVWSQALLWLLVLSGIACSSWGIKFFQRYALVVLLILISVYPKPGLMARILWKTFTPPNLLENFMAWSGTQTLKMMGQPAEVTGNIVSLPDGSVEVAWGCNGFNMAFTMAAAGLILGLFLQQSWIRTSTMMLIGILLALIFNIPRIVLLAFASVYWGQEAFDFWHGPMGGQLFTGVLFTIYYYAVMGFINQTSRKVLS